jgi:hypothetical protein
MTDDFDHYDCYDRDEQRLGLGEQMRLPKPIATGVRFQSRTLGSVYTAAQMKAYAAKAVKAEREACAKVCESITWSDEAKFFAKAIRERSESCI